MLLFTISLRARQLAGARKVKAFHVRFGLISPLKSFSSSPVNLSSRARCHKHFFIRNPACTRFQ
jgi:hypothetical protein